MTSRMNDCAIFTVASEAQSPALVCINSQEKLRD